METSQFDSFEASLTETSKQFLKEAGKWAKFLSIVGFIGIGLMVILAFFAGTILAALPNAGANLGFPSIVITVMYLIIAGLYFLPVYYLFNFGSSVKKGFDLNDNELLEKAFKNLKAHYKFIGILMIIMLSLYGIVLIPALIASAFM